MRTIGMKELRTNLAATISAPDPFVAVERRGAVIAYLVPAPQGRVPFAALDAMATEVMEEETPGVPEAEPLPLGHYAHGHEDPLFGPLHLEDH